MRKLNLIIIGLAITAGLFFTSCTDELSLQQFIVNQQEKQDVISFDLSSSLLKATEELKSKEDLEILKSLKKINVLAYQIKDSLNNRYQSEKQHISAILKQDKYQELMRYGKGSQGAKIYLLGEEEKIDELIIFGNDHKKGWLLIRVLGDNMQPEKIMQLMQKVDLKNTDFDLKKIINYEL